MHISYKTKTKEEHMLLFNLITTLGLFIGDDNDQDSIRSHCSGEYFSEYPYICSFPTSSNTTYFAGSSVPKNGDKDYTVYETIQEFVVALTKFKAPLSLKITNSYTAVLSDKGIAVGCQLVTWDKWDSLCTLVQKYKSLPGLTIS